MFINDRRFAMVIVVLALLLVPRVPAVANTVPSHATTHGIASAPTGLVAAIARAQTRTVANNSAYFIGRNGCAKLEDRNNTSALAGCFGQSGSAFTAGTSRVHLTLMAWGHKGQLQSVVLARMAPRANRIEYRGRHITEWWRVLPLGYEQGFMINHAPAGTGPVILQLTASAVPTLHHGELAWGKLRYGKLHVVDATGKVLPATLSARGKIISLVFNASNAHYPVIVDPMVWVQQEVTANNGAANDDFGTSVAISANGATALVGAYTKTVGGNSAQGAAYVYTENNGTWSQVAELTASNGAANDQFGISVALSSAGTTALVGALYKTVGSSAQGAAYVYTETNGVWSQTAELSASNGVAGDHFGVSVALSSTGDTALIGAYTKAVGGNSAQGAAYVYTMPGNGWATTSTYTAELIANNGTSSNYFGNSVALSSPGTTALVGAVFKTIGGNVAQGAAYVYTETKGVWSQVAELSASNGTASDSFGISVALSSTGATALVGAYRKTIGSNSAQGAAYVYTMPGSGWVSTSTYTAELVASNGAGSDFFGNSVALSGDSTTALVGAYNKTVGSNGAQGAAYVYTDTSGTWSQTAEFTAGNGTANDQFGFSGALSSTGGTALVGASFKAMGSNSAQGAAYFFTGSNLSAVLSAPATVAPGGQFDSQYILTNNSSSASGDVQVVLPAPASGASVAAVSSTGPKGVFGCTQNGTTQVITCDLGAIPGNGGSGSATLTLKVTGTVGMSIAQSAQLAGSVLPNLAQTASTLISNSAPLPGQPPVASNLTLTTYAGQALSGTLPAVVTPSSDALSYAVTQPAHGTVTVNATSGAFTYTPASSYSGPDSFTFSAKDTVTGLSSNTATVTITVKATPAPGQVPPVASNLTLTTYAGQALAGTLPAVVTPSSDALSYAVTQPSHGTLTVSATTGAFTYTPSAGYSGADSFTFSATDSVTSLVSNTATVTITVKATPAPGQVPPVASNLTLTTYAGQALAGTLPAVVTPSSDALSYAVTQPAHGTVTVNATSGAFTYTPSAGYSGADSFTFTAKDTVTGLSSNTATVTIIVKVTPAPGQVPPVASNLTLTTYAGQALAGTLPAVVTPSSDALSYAIASQPSHGTVTANATSGAFTYTPASSYSGADSFTFSATDSVTSLVSNTATVTITVKATPAPGQVPPVASNLTLTTYAGQALAGTLPAVVTPSSDALSYAVASQPANGTVTANATSGAFTYTPSAGYSGADSFTFSATDTVTGLSSNTATVTITVKVTPVAPPAPPGPSGNGGGGGALGPWTLAALLGLMLLAALQRRRKTMV